MSSNAQLYTKSVIYVNGALLGEAQSITVNRTTNSQPVSTIAKGYSGESPGAAMVEVSVDNVVPSADFELNPGDFMGKMKSAEFTVVVAGKTMTFEGFIYQDNFSYAVNSEAKLSFSARGGFSDFS